jgi:hypothetical protein
MEFRETVANLPRNRKVMFESIDFTPVPVRLAERAWTGETDTSAMDGGAINHCS